MNKFTTFLNTLKINNATSLFLCSLTWALVVFIQERIFGKLFLSIILAAIICLVAFLHLLSHKKYKPLFLILGAIVFWLILISISKLNLTHFLPNGLGEAVKFFTVFFCGMLIAKSFSHKTLSKSLIPLPLVFLLFLLIKLLFYKTFLISDGRFELYSSLGSPNTIGFLCSFLVIYTLYNLRPLYLKYGALCLLLIFLGITFSRSAILGLVIGLAAPFLIQGILKLFPVKIVTLRIIFLIFLLILNALIFYTFHQIHKTTTENHRHLTTNISNPDPTPSSRKSINFTNYLATTQQARTALIKMNKKRFEWGGVENATVTGSGRLILWDAALNNVWQHKKSWLTGFGPGNISQLNVFNAHYPSTDSIIILALHSYGLIGLLCALIFVTYLCFPTKLSDSAFKFKCSLGTFMSIVLITNNTTTASQTLLYGMLMIGLIFSNSHPNKNQ